MEINHIKHMIKYKFNKDYFTKIVYKYFLDSR